MARGTKDPSVPAHAREAADYYRRLLRAMKANGTELDDCTTQERASILALHQNATRVYIADRRYAKKLKTPRK